MRSVKIYLVTILLVLCTTTVAALSATAPSSKDKCPVCGMFVAKFPDWTATISFKDNSSLFFDGAKDLFTYFHNMKKYTPTRNQGDIVRITVRDYYALQQIDARSAWFVSGSDVYGPMGHELIPFAREADGREFMRDHKGKKILRFNEVSVGIVKGL